MTPVRLLAVALLLCSLPAIAQDNKLGVNISGPVNPLPRDFKAYLGTPRGVAATTAEPWRVIPNQLADASPHDNPMSHLRIDEYQLPQSSRDDRAQLVIPSQDSGAFPTAQPQAADTICYSIRSYQVARDSKSSDATHPAGYSTCQPASRYHVKSAVGQTHSDR